MIDQTERAFDGYARDVVQETWIAVIRGLKRLDDPVQFPAWLYRIAHRKCADHIRFNQRQGRLIASVERESEIAADSNRGADGRGESADFTAAIADIASILSLPVGTVKSRLHHARESLKNQAGE
ncbi:MAG: RNA polymerase sigma factor [Pseudomonadota bacterium]